MENIYLKRISEIRREKDKIERILNIEINIKGKIVYFEGKPLDEYEALQIFEAMKFGFTLKKALLLIEPDIQFQKLNIKDFTRRKDLYEVRARIIGKDGKTKRTIEYVSDCSIELNDNTVGIIGNSEEIDAAVTALKSLIHGSKEGNVYRYLERMNTERRKIRNENEDLGIKIINNK